MKVIPSGLVDGGLGSGTSAACAAPATFHGSPQTRPVEQQQRTGVNELCRRGFTTADKRG